MHRAELRLDKVALYDFEPGGASVEKFVKPQTSKLLTWVRSILSNFGGKKKIHIKKENCSIPLRPPPCHKIWMSRKVICVCWEMKCSTGLKTYCICLEICFPGRMSGVSEREAAACVSSKREGRHSHH